MPVFIKNTFFRSSSLAGSSNFKLLTYTGNATVRSITGAGFAPDLVMTFTGAVGTVVYDTARGTTKYFQAASNTAQSTDAQSLTAFGGDGFSLGTATVSNFTGGTYRAFCWDKTPSFMDIVTYTGTGSNRTVSHSLGVTPALMLVKRLDGASNPRLYSAFADATSAQDYSFTWNGSFYSRPLDTTVWNGTAPTSSVFSLGSNSDVNASGGSYVAYLFAGVTAKAKTGVYTGTGATGNAITGLGFQPSLILIVRRVPSSSTCYWNYAAGKTGLNSNTPETSVSVSLDSDGFTVNTTSADFNTSGQVYIYFAWK